MATLEDGLSGGVKLYNTELYPAVLQVVNKGTAIGKPSETGRTDKTVWAKSCPRRSRQSASASATCSLNRSRSDPQ